MRTGTKRTIDKAVANDDVAPRTRTRSVRARLSTEGAADHDTIQPPAASKAQVRGKQRRPNPKNKVTRSVANPPRSSQRDMAPSDEDEIQPQSCAAGSAQRNDLNSSDHSTVSLRVSPADEAARSRACDRRDDRTQDENHDPAKRDQVDAVRASDMDGIDTPLVTSEIDKVVSNEVSPVRPAPVPMDDETSPLVSRQVKERVGAESLPQDEVESGNDRTSSPSRVLPSPLKAKSHGKDLTNRAKTSSESVGQHLSKTEEVDYAQVVADIDDVRVMQKVMNRKLNKVVDIVEQIGDVQDFKDECDELRNIIHSLLGQIELGNPNATVISNKLVPLKRALIGPGGVHKRSVGKYIIDKLVRTCDTENLDMKTLNNFAAVLRTVLYSTNSGGRKEYKGDNDEMAEHHNEMKKKITFICVNAIQGKEDIGQLTLFCNGEDKVISKPAWMRKGFTKGKHISEFYNNGRQSKPPKQGEDEDECEVLQHHIIKKINDTHNICFNKIRDRVRVDGMKEMWFLFEDYDFVYQDGPPSTQPLFQLSKLPTPNLHRIPDNDLPSVVKKVWNGLRDIANNQFSYLVEYNVEVGKKQRMLRRNIDLVAVSTMILMRISCASTIVDLLSYNSKGIYAIVTLAEILRHLLQLHRRRSADNYLNEITKLCPDYHVVNLLQDIRPTKSATRKEMAHKCVKEMDEGEFERLHHGDSLLDDEEKNNNDELVDLDDNGEFGDDLKDAIEFLL